METNVLSVTPHRGQDQDVAQLLNKYDFSAMPVVDRRKSDGGHRHLRRRHGRHRRGDHRGLPRRWAAILPYRPYLRTGGEYREKPYSLADAADAATFTGIIITSFEERPGRCVVLIGFIPMLMGTAGNSGSQSSVAVMCSIAGRN